MLWTSLIATIAATSVSGTVEVNGCRFRPTQVQLRAVPLAASITGERAPEPSPPLTDARRGASAARAVISRTSDPHVFSFLIEGLLPAAAYQLRIRVPPNPCGRVFWRGPTGGLVAAGQSRLLIEGFTATTELEVFDPRGRSWVGRDHVGFADPATGTRAFRWRSAGSAEIDGELQVATAPFPVDADACAEPAEGLILRRPLGRSSGRWARIPKVDFNELLLPARGRFAANPGSRTRALTAAGVERLVRGAPLYVRVAARAGRGRVCDTKQHGVSSSVVLAQLPEGPLQAFEPPPDPPVLEAGDNHAFKPAFLNFENDGAIHPNYVDQTFLVIRPHAVPSLAFCQAFYALDAYGCTLRAGGVPAGLVLQPGWRVSYSQTTSGGGGGFWDVFTSALPAIVTGAISGAGLAVDFLSQIYEDVKAAAAKVVKTVIQVVPGLGDLCNAHPSQCEAAIEAGINAGLAAIGMPPSLPNWDELKQQGVDYLAAEIASQTGVPQEVVDKALEVAQETLEEMTANRGILPQPGYNWLVPYYGVTPATLILEVKKNDLAPPPTQIYLTRKATLPFVGDVTRLPSTFPGNADRLRIPLVMQPNLAGIPAPLCTSVSGGPLTCGPNFFAPQTAVCRTATPTFPGFTYSPFPCPEKQVAVYYRDAWIPRLASGCTTLQTLSLGQAFHVVPPDPPFHPLPTLKLAYEAVPGYFVLIVGQVQPPVPFEWDGAFGSACNP